MSTPLERYVATSRFESQGVGISVAEPEPTGVRLEEIWAELRRARKLFPRPYASAHEGYNVLLEEVDELWDEVRSKSHGDQTERKARMRKEAVQVAAMALRFIEECCE